jgi:DNA-binding IclR family transcriptional regulator
MTANRLEIRSTIVDTNVVKSAGRALAILEFFSDVRRPASATAIRRAFGLPASSATALLRSLVELGYLHYRPGDRTYIPTVRTELLADWRPHLFSDGRPLNHMLHQLGESTRQLVVVGARCKSHAQYVHVVRCSDRLRNVRRGTIAPLTRTAVGWMLLSRLADREIRGLCVRTNAEASADDRISPDWLIDRIDEVRTTGYAFCFGRVTPTAGAVAMALPVPSDQPPLVLAISGTGDAFVQRKDELITMMTTGIAEYRAHT